MTTTAPRPAHIDARPLDLALTRVARSLGALDGRQLGVAHRLLDGARLVGDYDPQLYAALDAIVSVVDVIGGVAAGTSPAGPTW